MLAKIEWSKIAELLWAAPLAGLAVAVTFSLVIASWARAADARRDGHATAATAYSTLTALAGLAFAAVVVFGVVVIANK